MLPGFNHNVRFNDRIYHVQTEDNGLKTASVVTQVFLAGQVLALEKISYRDVLDELPAENERIAEIQYRMREQHKTLLKRVTQGAFERRVETLIHEGVASPDAGRAPPRPTPTADVPNPPGEQTTDALPALAQAAQNTASDAATMRIEESDFLSSLDAEVRRHIEASDPTLPPFDSSILPAEPPPILPRTHRATPAKTNPPLSSTPLRTRRVRPAAPRDTLVDEPSPLALKGTPTPNPILDRRSPPPAEPRPKRPVRFRRPASGTTVRPLEQDELRRASAEMGLPMPEEPGHSDPNATLLELDAVALKAKLAEQRAKLKRASELAAEKWVNTPPPRTDSSAERVTVNERSLDEVLMSYLEDE